MSAAPGGVHFQDSSIVLLRLADENSPYLKHGTRTIWKMIYTLIYPLPLNLASFGFHQPVPWSWRWWNSPLESMIFHVFPHLFSMAAWFLRWISQVLTQFPCFARVGTYHLRCEAPARGYRINGDTDIQGPRNMWIHNGWNDAFFLGVFLRFSWWCNVICTQYVKLYGAKLWQVWQVRQRCDTIWMLVFRIMWSVSEVIYYNNNLQNSRVGVQPDWI